MSARKSSPALDFGDLADVGAWLVHLGVLVEDLDTVIADQLRPPSTRRLGRPLARDLADEALGGIEALLAFARAGLDDDAPDSGDPSGSGGAGPTH
jgi:hypothetical protein